MNKFASSYLGAMGRKCADLHKEKKHRDYSVPIGLGLAGAGYGLGHAANTMFNIQDEASMLQAPAKMYDIQHTSDPTETTVKYVKAMSDASQAKMWGLNSRKVLEPIRRFFDKVPFLDHSDSWNDESAHHYDSFVDGPNTAYREEIPESIAPPYGSMTHAESMSRFDAARDSLANSLGLPAGPLNFDQQKSMFPFLRNHIEKVDPDLHKVLLRGEKYMQNEIRGDAEGYSDLVSNLLHVRNGMRYAGAAAGLTGLGLLGWYAWRKAHAKKNELESKKAPAPVEFNLPVAGASIKLAILAHHVSSSLQH